ncbi:unnamed protein product [Orchesella dallaii]|uniref:C-type lectin domain-containing protein n=1 Tax=Orchesella dallaii TaxID=48710 RepID=A0ABP1S1H3_9HEXA
MEAKQVTLMILPFVIFTTVSGAGTTGKFYHADSETRNWTESIDFCKTNGYSLAKNLTKDAVDMLKTKHDSVKFTGTHWISATSRVAPRLLAWDSATGAPFTNIFGIPWHAPPSSLCGAFYSDGATSYFRTLSCSLNYKTLCEQSIP